MFSNVNIFTIIIDNNNYSNNNNNNDNNNIFAIDIYIFPATTSIATFTKPPSTLFHSFPPIITPINNSNPLSPPSIS